MSNIIDLSTLLGEVKTYERLVNGRKVIIDDILFEDVPKYEKAINDRGFIGIYEKAKELLEGSKVEGGVDEAWLEAIPFAEASDLLTFVLYPEFSNEQGTYEPTPVRVSPELEILLPLFTLGDAKAYGSHYAEGSNKTMSAIAVERFTTILDNVKTSDGKPLPDGALKHLTQRQVGALIHYYINRTVEREEGKAESSETSSETETDSGPNRSGRSSGRSRSTTSKKKEQATSEV